jgi:hypothetical protein
MIQEYYKSERMKEQEAHARKLEHFHEIRRVSMAANIVDGHLIIGNRHFCPLMEMQIDGLQLDYHKHNIRYDQGFVDQWGIYMSRGEAWGVAKARGQIKEVFQEGILFSECYL